MRVSFMGTPDFAIPILDAILEAGHELCFVVTQPDRPKGRGHALAPSPVKQWALDHGITVYTPVRVREPEEIARLRDNPVDVCVVAAFGQILPKEVLEIPGYGCINVHASLLPKYRGAAPIQWSILNGDENTGVTIMQMDEGLDSGDILLQREIPIEAEDTAGSLFDKLAVLGAEALVEALSLLEEGKLTARPQDESLATTVKKVDKSLAKLDFSAPAAQLSNYVRGLNPWPVAVMDLDGKPLKIHRALALSEEDLPDEREAGCGEIVRAKGDELIVRTGDGYLKLLEVQLPGRKRLSAGDFLRGHKI